MENKLWNIYTIEYSPAIKKNERLIYATTWRSLPHIVVNERSQTRGCILYMILKKRSKQAMVIEGRIVVTAVRCGEEGGY